MKKLKKFLIPLLLCSVVCFIPETRAEVIEATASFNDVPGGTTIAVSGNVSKQNTIYLYNYEGVTRPYVYLTFSVCTNGPVNFSIANVGYSNYFLEDSIDYYSAGKACTVSNFNGSLFYVQIKVGKYEDLDGTGEELLASSYLNVSNNWSYGVYYAFKNFYLSSDDTMEAMRSNKQILDKFNAIDDDLNTMNTNLNSINNILSNNNSKLDSVNSSIGQTNQKLDSVNNSLNNVNSSIKDTQNYLKDDTAPSADIDVLGNVQGILPEGPIDSLLNIPFKVLSILNSSFGGVCVPISGKFVFDSTLTIPCFSDLFYSNVPDSIMIFINVVPTAFILIAYLKNLYKRVDRALSLETSADDEWGGI